MEKPWTVTSGVIAATERDVEKAAAINALLVSPIAVLPEKPGDPIRPFAVGIFNELRQLAKPDAALMKLRRAIAAYAHSKRYLFASAQPDAMRHDLAGMPVEPVSSKDRLVAQRRFMEIKKTGRVAEPQTPLAAAPSLPAPSKNDLIRASLLKRRDRQE